MHEIWKDLFVLGIPLLEKILRPILVYAFLVVSLRLSGKRELVQLNPFDLVVLLTLSNTVQNAIIGDDNSVLGGIISATSLLATNFLVVRFLYRHRKLDQLVEGRADVLIEDGKVRTQHLKTELITMAQLEAAARKQGFSSLSEVSQCVLEPGGTLTFVGKKPAAEEVRHHELLGKVESLAHEIALLRGSWPPARAQDHAGQPKTFALGKQSNGADDQTDFEKGLPCVEPVGFTTGKVALRFQVRGLLADIFFVALIVFHFLEILLSKGFTFSLIHGSNQVDHVRKTLRFVKAHAFCLILRPFVGRLTLP